MPENRREKRKAGRSWREALRRNSYVKKIWEKVISNSSRKEIMKEEDWKWLISKLQPSAIVSLNIMWSSVRKYEKQYNTKRQQLRRLCTNQAARAAMKKICEKKIFGSEMAHLAAKKWRKYSLSYNGEAESRKAWRNVAKIWRIYSPMLANHSAKYSCGEEKYSEMKEKK